MTGPSTLHLKDPSYVVHPHQRASHGETYSKTAGDRAKQQYCQELDAILDCLNHGIKSMENYRDAILEVRTEKFTQAPADIESEIANEFRRVIKHIARLQLLHSLGVNTGPRPTESRHIKREGWGASNIKHDSLLSE